MPVSLSRCILLLCLALHVSWVLASDLTASVDRSNLSLNESVTLTVRYEGRTMGEPDFSDLSRDFDILSNQRQSQFSFGSGQGASYTLWILELMPKRGGKLLMPSFHLKGNVSDAFEITVTASAPSSDTSQKVFVETELETNSAYVNQQVLLTYRLHTAIMLRDLGMSELSVAGANPTKISDNQYQKTLNGMSYTVVEIKYALFPEQAGKLIIPSVRFSGTIPDNNRAMGSRFFTQRGKRLAHNSDEKTLTVKPKPSNLPAGPWLPSKGLSLAERWSKEPKNLVVGEPITRAIIISAQGLRSSQLPPLTLTGTDKFKIYPDQPQLEDRMVADGILGTRIESIAIVPTKPGSLTLPEVKLQWWDTVSNKLRETQLQAVTVNVLPSSLGSEQTAEIPPTAFQSSSIEKHPLIMGKDSNYWINVLVALNLLLLLCSIGLGLLWWRATGRQTTANTTSTDTQTRVQTESEKTAFKQLLACKTEQLPAFRDAIMHWARIHWQNAVIKTLDDIVNLSGHTTLRNQFTQLDILLYSGNKPGMETTNSAIIDALKTELTNLRQTLRQQQQQGDRQLTPLYPGGT